METEIYKHSQLKTLKNSKSDILFVCEKLCLSKHAIIFVALGTLIQRRLLNSFFGSSSDKTIAAVSQFFLYVTYSTTLHTN